jgi:hypothetical protein
LRAGLTALDSAKPTALSILKPATANRSGLKRMTSRDVISPLRRPGIDEKRRNAFCAVTRRLIAKMLKATVVGIAETDPNPKGAWSRVDPPPRKFFFRKFEKLSDGDRRPTRERSEKYSSTLVRPPRLGKIRVEKFLFHFWIVKRISHVFEIFENPYLNFRT